MRYQHTQRSWIALVLGGAVAFVPLIVAFALGRMYWLGLLTVFIIAVLWVFSSLTVEADESEVRWFFGPGVWRKRMARAEIASVEQVRNKWWWGFGIRLTPHGWLYNVAGLDAVQITGKDGKTLRIGTDEPQKLAAALST